MSPKLQKQSALKLAGRIIPRSGGFNAQACFGVYTRDLIFSAIINKYD
jgi:hypothetical protein